MRKQHWIVMLVSATVLCGLLLISLPQGTSDASSQRLTVLLSGTPSTTPTITPTLMQLVVEVPIGNLRAVPGIGSDLIGTVKQNTRLTVMGVAYYGTQVWYLVQLEGNDQAWVSDTIVRIVGNAELVATIDLTEFFAYTDTPTWTPGGPTATASTTPKPGNSTRTPTKTVIVPSTSTPVPTSGSSSNHPPTATSGAVIPQPTNPPPQPTNIPPTSVPPQPTNPPAPTNQPPPQPTNLPPPTSQPVPPTAGPGIESFAGVVN